MYSLYLNKEINTQIEVIFNYIVLLMFPSIKWTYWTEAKPERDNCFTGHIVYFS